MKRIIYLVLIIIVIICVYNLVVAKPRSYQLNYKYNDYDVSEKYDAEIGSYTFVFNHEGGHFVFGLNHKYTSKRKLIQNVNEIEEDNASCMNIKVLDTALSTMCYDYNGTIYDASIKNNREDKEIKKINNISIYNDKYSYYIWNGYGLTNVLTKKEYNVLKKESYNNNLSTSVGDYIMFANYDEGTKYKTLYIFNVKDNEYKTLELENNIDSDAYIMGNIDNAIYIFDRKNAKEFKIELDTLKASIVSDANGGVIYNDSRKESIPIEQLKYNDYQFSYHRLYDYIIENKQLYLTYYGTGTKIKVSNNDNIKDIIKIEDDQVFYIGENNKIYTYNIKKKEQTLIENFEWNFSYNNKIFVFNK